MCCECVVITLRSTAFVNSVNAGGIGLAIYAEVLWDLIGGIGGETNLDIIQLNVEAKTGFIIS